MVETVDVLCGATLVAKPSSAAGKLAWNAQGSIGMATKVQERSGHGIQLWDGLSMHKEVINEWKESTHQESVSWQMRKGGSGTYKVRLTVRAA